MPEDVIMGVDTQNIEQQQKEESTGEGRASVPYEKTYMTTLNDALQRLAVKKDELKCDMFDIEFTLLKYKKGVPESEYHKRLCCITLGDSQTCSVKFATERDYNMSYFQDNVLERGFPLSTTEIQERYIQKDEYLRLKVTFCTGGSNEPIENILIGTVHQPEGPGNFRFRQSHVKIEFFQAGEHVAINHITFFNQPYFDKGQYVLRERLASVRKKEANIQDIHKRHLKELNVLLDRQAEK